MVKSCIGCVISIEKDHKQRISKVEEFGGGTHHTIKATTANTEALLHTSKHKKSQGLLTTPKIASMPVKVNGWRLK